MKRQLSFFTGVSCVAILALAAGCTTNPDTAPESSDLTDTALSKYWYPAMAIVEPSSIVEFDSSKEELFESTLADCMKAQGFDYFPDDRSIVSEGSEEVAGYGIIPSFSDVMGEDSIQAPDANAEYVAGLDEAAQEAYSVAMEGDMWQLLAEDPEAGWDNERAGCVGAAMAATEGGEDALMKALETSPYYDLAASVLALEEEIVASEEWIEGIGVWSDCMAREGRAYRDLDGPFNDLYQRLDDLLATTILSPEEQESGEDAEVRLRVGLEHLAAEELVIFEADQRCRREVGLDSFNERARRAVEEDFFQRHSKELSEMFDWFYSLPGVI